MPMSLGLHLRGGLVAERPEREITPTFALKIEYDPAMMPSMALAG